MVDEKFIKNENAWVKEKILINLEKELDTFIEQLKKLARDPSTFEHYHRDGKNQGDGGTAVGSTHHPLNASSLTREHVMQNLEECIVGNMYYPTNEEEIARVDLGEHMDGDQKLVVMASMAAAFCATALDSPPPVSCFENVANKIVTDCLSWISSLFGQGPNSLCHFHPEIQDGVLTVLKVSLHHNYPSYAQMGYLALVEHPPIIYMADTALNARIGKYVCQKLGLGYETLSLIPCKEILTGDGEIVPTTIYDSQALGDALKNDTHQNKRPLLILAHAGTPNFGEVDDIETIGKLCHKYSIWFHVQGDNLAALPLLFGDCDASDGVEMDDEDDFGEVIARNSYPKIGSDTLHGPPTKPVSTAERSRADSKRLSNISENLTREPTDHGEDLTKGRGRFCTSLTVSPNTWLGLPPTLPHVTIYRPLKNDFNALRFSGIGLDLHSMLPFVLPYWIFLRKMGTSRIVKVLGESFTLGKYLIRTLERIPQIGVVPNYVVNSNLFTPNQTLPSTHGVESQPTLDGGKTSPATQKSAVYTLLNSIQSSAVFRYQFDRDYDSSYPHLPSNPIDTSITELSISESTSPRREKRNGEYLNALNTWLCQIMNREFSKIELNLVQKEGCTRVFIECCFVKTFAANKVTESDIDRFVEVLIDKLEIMDATHRKRGQLADTVRTYDNLKLVNLPYWAGLGAVHYIPDIWVGHSDNLPKIMSDQLDLLNETIVDELRGTDSAFATGKMENGLSCIGFGMITKDTNVDELSLLVVNLGKRVEKSIKLSDRISSIIARGIKAATEDLEKENEAKFQKEGVLRHVPVIGSLLNWWNPSPHHVIKGRSFDLDSGRLEQSERKAYTIKPLGIVSNFADDDQSPTPSDRLLDTPSATPTPRSSLSNVALPAVPVFPSNG